MSLGSLNPSLPPAIAVAAQAVLCGVANRADLGIAGPLSRLGKTEKGKCEQQCDTPRQW